jgi:hypothetical protein
LSLVSLVVSLAHWDSLSEEKPTSDLLRVLDFFGEVEATAGM